MSSTPNILHLFTDQQRFDTIGALGNPVIRTPVLDRLVEEGVAFTNAFSPSPVCVPARCSMIYGQYPHHTGCYDNGRMPQDGRESLMDALTRAGYRTHGIGKCHFTPEKYASRGFQTREVLEGGIGKDLEREPYIKHLFDHGYTHISEPHGSRGEMYYIPQPSQVPAEMHPSHWTGDRSVAFIREQAASEGPWYLYAGFFHPHPPFTPPNPWHKLYRAPLMPLPNQPPDSEALLTYINRHQNRYKYRDQGVDLNLLRCIKAYYYACISFIDYQVGRILEALEATGQRENTMIVVSSDHGELLGDYGCVGKRSMHDASARIPMIVSWPGVIEGGTTCDAPVSLVDLAPTFLSAAETALESHVPDGVDLRRVLSGDSNREMVFSQFAPSRLPDSCRRSGALDASKGGADEDSKSTESEHPSLSIYMAVSRTWKYVYSAGDDREFLFDKIRDPQETRNRAGSPFCREALTSMRSALMTHLRDGGETAGLDGDRWRSFLRIEMQPDPDAGLLVQDNYTPWSKMEIPGYSD